ncbi:MAG: T9SS type A sorting domain-containing protein, partial [Flavobacteriaceae bacterium]|nr:T9SS type A sorting domain-containing protein [Flavobacteriaceae bacterium]
NIEASYFISITSDLIVNGVLNIQHEGSLMTINNNGIVVNNGEIKIHKTTTSIKQYDYTYWSSPVKNSVIETVFATSPQNSFFYFETQNYLDANNDDIDDNNNAWQPAQGNMELGKGYTAMAPNTDPFIDKQSVIFTGEVNNGEIELPVFLSEDNANEDDDWNLIGNPYPSAINAQLFLNNPNNSSMLGGSIYFWTHNTAAISNSEETEYSSNDYAIYNVGTGGIMANSKGVIPTGFIASCQGFFVEAKQQGNILFNNEMRMKTSNDNFFKSDRNKNNEEQDKIWLNLYNNKGAFSQILIGFIDGATPLYESNFDGLRIGDGSFVSFYSISENKQLAIQGTQSFSGDEIISLGFSSKIEKEVALKIGIDHLEGDLKNKDIYLYDYLLQKSHNLKLEDYEFDLESKGVFKDRFSLKFNNTNLDVEGTHNKDENLLIKNSEEYLIIKTNKNSVISSVKIYDMLGRNILQAQVNQPEVSFKSSVFKTSGIYIIYVKLENSNIIIKKIIR